MTLRHPRRQSQQPSFPQPLVAPRLYRDIAITFLGLTAVIIGIVLWMSSVRATIVITTKRDVTTVDGSVAIAKSPEQGELQGRVVEGTFDNIQAFNVSAPQATSSAPTITTGRVRIFNEYSKPQTLIKTTRLLTADGKLFRIASTVTIPSSKTVDVEAYSDQPGQQFVIPSETKMSIPGLWIDLQKWIYAQSLTPFVGTQTTSTKTVTPDDIANAQSQLQTSIVDQAKKTLIAEAGISSDKLDDACVGDQDCWQSMYFVTPVDKKTNATAGQRADTFLAQVKVKVTAVFYPRKDMELFVRGKLKDRLPDGRELADFDPSKVTYKLVQADASAARAQISFEVQASSRLTAQDPALSPGAIAGMSVADAKDTLSKIDGVASVEITMHPSWASKIPSQKSAIDLKIQ